ncbi:MAG: hypothetical protein JNN01_24965 [Opitutaceae bacterium]|nr:hypothetical protein [Opitutaceae bacterium]
MDERLSPGLTYRRRMLARGWIVLLPLVVGLWFLLQRVRIEQQGLERAIRDAQFVVQRLEAESTPGGPPAGVALIPETKPSPLSPAEPKRPPGFSDRDVLGDPELGSAVARRHRRYALANYRRAIDSLELTAPERARLKELIAERWLAREDAREMLRRLGNLSPEQAAKATAEAQAETDASMRSLLGDERYARLKENYELISEKGMDWQRVTGFWDAGVPVSESQQLELVRARREIRQRLGEGEENGRDPATGFKQSETLLLQAAVKFLSPAQLEFLREEWRLEARLAQASREVEALRNQERGLPR